MKKISFTHCLLALVMIGFYALPALASQSPHWAENNINCLDCHITHQGPKTPCTDCHNNLNGSGYSKQVL